MIDIYTIRKNNLQMLLRDRTARSIADALGYKGSSYISQMVGRKANRPITEVTARRLEQALGLSDRWLDTPRDLYGDVVAPGSKPPMPERTPPPTGALVDQETFMHCVEVVDAALRAAGISPSPAKKRELVAMVYEELPLSDTKLQKFADRLVRLLA